MSMGGASIDERIVKLMFDNKLFEQNAQTSISTLEKLKQALKLDDASKSLDALEKKMSNQSSLEKIGKTVDSLKDRFSAGGIIGMRVLQNLTDSAMNMGKKLLDAVNVPLEQIKQGGWTRAMNLEQAKFQIESLGASWEKVYKDMDFAVTGTAYGMDAAAKVAAQLTASGIEAGDEMAHVLRGISGVAAMTGSTYEDIGNIMATVAGNGRLYAQQLNQFAYRGLNATAVLAKHFNTTESEIREMVKAGEIDFRTFGEVMYEAFGESAVRANELFSGALSNTKAALSRIGADVAANSLVQFRDVLNACRIAVNNFHTALGGPDSGLLGDINNVVTGVSQGIVKFMSDERFTKAMNKFAKGLQNGFKIITNSMTALRDIISVKFFKGQDANDVFLSLTTSFKNFTKSLSENKSLTTDIYHIFGGIMTIIKQLGITFGQVAGGVKQFFSTFEGLKVLNNLIKSFKNVLMGVKSVLEPIGKAFMNVFGDTNWKWVTEASRKLKDFTKQLRLSEEASKKVEDVFTKVFTAIKNIGTIAGDVAGGALNKLAEVWGKLAPDGIKITSGTKEIEKHFGSLDTLVKKTVKVFEDGDKATQASYVRGIIGKLKANPIAGPILTAVDSAVMAFRKFQASFPTDALSKFGQTVSTTFDAVKNTVGGWVENIIERVKNLDISFESPIDTLKRLGKALGTVGSKISTFVKNLKPFEKFKGVIDKLKESGSGLFELIGEGFDKVKNFISSVLTGGEGGGISNVLDSVGKAFTRLGKKIDDFVGKLDISKVVAIGYVAMLTALTIGVYNLLTGLGDMTKGIGSFFKKGGEFLDSLRPIKESRSTLESAAVAITAVSAALFVLSQVPFDQLVHGLMALGAVMLGTTGFLAALEGLAYAMKRGNFIKEFSALSAAVPMIAGSIFILSLAMKQLNDVETEGLGLKVLALAGVMAALGVLSYKMNALLEGDGKNFQKNALAVLLFSISLYTISKSLVKLAEIPWQKAYQAFANAIPVLGMAAIISLVVSKLSFSAGAGFVLGIAGLQLLIMVLENLGKKNWDSMKANIESFGGILLAFIGVVGLVGTVAALIGRITGLNIGKMAKDFGVGMLGMAGAVYLIALACEKIGSMDATTIRKGSTVVAELIIIFGLFSVLSRLGKGQDYKGMALSFIGVSLAITSLVGAIYLLGSMDSNVLKRGTVAVSALIIFMGLFAKLSSAGSAMDAKTIASLAGTIVVLSLSLIVLAQLSWDEIARGLTAMGVALGEFVAAFAIIQKVGKGATSIEDIGLIVALVVAAGGVAFALSKLAAYDWPSLLAAATALGGVLLAMATSFGLLSQFGANTFGWVAAVVVQMGAGVLAVIGISAALSRLAAYDWASIAAAGAAVSAALLAIAGSMSILSLFGPDTFTEVIAAAASMAIGVAGIWGIVKAVQPLLNYDYKAIDAAFSGITTVLLSLSAVFSVFGVIAFGGPAVMATAVVGLLAAVAGIVTVIGVIGALCNNVAGVEAAITKGLEILGRIGQGIGTAIGLFVSGLMAGLATGLMILPSIGAALSAFMVSMGPFIAGLNQLNDSAVKSAKILATTILTFGAASVMDAIARFLTLGTGGIGSFASSIVPLGEGISAFADSIKDLSEDSLKKVKIAAKACEGLAELAKSVPREGGLVQAFIGENGFATFAKTLADQQIGQALKQFADDVADIDNSAVKKGADAGKMIAEFAKSIGNDGGLIAELIGDNKLSDFAAALTSGENRIGVALSTFANDVSAIDESAVKKGTSAGQMIAEFANSIGNEGGLLADLIGDNTLSNLASGLMDASGGARIGVAISTFVKDMGDISKGDATKAAAAGETIAGFAESVGNTDFGLFDFIGMQNFARSLNSSGIGKAIAQFVTDIQSVSKSGPEKASAAGEVVLNFATGVKSANLDASKITDIAKALTTPQNGYTVGQAIRAFESSIASLPKTSVQKASDAAAMVTNFLNGMKSVGTKSIPNFGTQLVTLGKKVQEFAETMQKVNATGISTVATNIINTINRLSESSISTAINNMKSKASNFTTVGNTIVTKIKEGITAKQSVLNAACGSLVANAAASIRNSANYNSFQAAGNYLAIGFASGISSGTGASAAATAGATLAKKALDGIKKAAEINSPSKAAERLGGYVDEGFGNGIRYNSTKVGEAVNTVTGIVVDKFGNAVSPVVQTGKDMMSAFTGSADGITTLIPALNQSSTALNGVTTAASGTSQALDKTTESSKKTKEAAKEQTTFLDTIKGAVQSLNDLLNGETKVTAEQANQNLATATDKVAGLSEKILQAKQASNDATTASGENTEKAKSHLAELTEAYNEYHNSLSQAISSQLNLFEAREKQEKISSEDMIKNMASQVHAVMGWEANVKKLSKSAIDQGLLLELAKLGPEGAAKVESFVGMTDKQLARVNHLYRMRLKIDQTTADEIIASMANMGKGMSDSVANNIDTHATDTKMAELGTNAVAAVKVTAGVGTDSGVSEQTKPVGQALVQGVNAGIDQDAPTVNEKIMTFTDGMTASITAAIAKFSETKTVHILQGFIDGVNEDQRTMYSKLDTTFKEVNVKVDNFAKKFKPAGEASIQGYANGILAKKNQATSAANVVCNAVGHVLKTYISYFEIIGHNLTVGVANGMISPHAIEQIEKAAKYVVIVALQAMMDAANMASPSKITRQYGVWMDQGFANGMADSYATKNVVEAATNVVDSALEAFERIQGVGDVVSEAFSDAEALLKMESTIDKIANSINENMDVTPVIVPELDLSHIVRDAQSIGSMFDAVTIGTSANSNYQANGDETAPVGGGMTFIQNNYSPKALGTGEIYRQTKNQFAMAKGMVGLT